MCALDALHRYNRVTFKTVSSFLYLRHRRLSPKVKLPKHTGSRSIARIRSVGQVSTRVKWSKQKGRKRAAPGVPVPRNQAHCAYGIRRSPGMPVCKSRFPHGSFSARADTSNLRDLGRMKRASGASDPPGFFRRSRARDIAPGGPAFGGDGAGGSEGRAGSHPSSFDSR